jgi:hypothetical protein
MKGFVRNNQYLSLCGLNCKLCPMNLAGHCSGCGVDNQSCKIAKCSIEHGKIEYCFQCTSFPCDKYAHIDDFDSFITHHNQMNDMEKASQIGIPAYNAEQLEARAKASEKGKMKDTMERAKLESELKDIQRLVDRIPPEVLAELKRQQRHTRER